VHSLSQTAVARTETVDVSGGPAPEQLRAAVVSASYFEVLGGAAAAGQLFSPSDDRSGARPIVVVSDAVWRRRLGAAVDAVGQTLLLNGQPHVVIAVMPRGFRGPEGMNHDDVDLWLPLGRLKLSADPDDAGLGTIAMIGKGIEPATAIREIESVGRSLAEGTGGNSASRFWTAPLRASTVGDAGMGLWMLFGAVSLLLIIACTNVANLFLVRATERRQEIAVRAALGAGRSRIARQLITETLGFSLAGGAVGAGPRPRRHRTRPGLGSGRPSAH
jgi:ABC-type antimicrobial peptide transport system permease subunit